MDCTGFKQLKNTVLIHFELRTGKWQAEDFFPTYRLYHTPSQLPSQLFFGGSQLLAKAAACERKASQWSDDEGDTNWNNNEL